MARNQHVVPVGDRWGVRGEGNQRLTSISDTQREAIADATTIARQQRSELLIHGQNGQIRERASYDCDPCPPVDKA